MSYLNTNSLFETVDNVSEALFFQKEITGDEKNGIIEFIIRQQDHPLAYYNTFAPTEQDMKGDLVLFTGEKIKTKAGRRHMIGEESSRILRLIGQEKEEVQKALKIADNGILSCIEMVRNHPKYIHGTYCCKACSTSLWLNLSSGGLRNDESMLTAGIRYLKHQRDRDGSWQGFPPNYILYVLNEIQNDLALDELKYAGPTVERRLKRLGSPESKFEVRKKAIYERILEKIDS